VVIWKSKYEPNVNRAGFYVTALGVVSELILMSFSANWLILPTLSLQLVTTFLKSPLPSTHLIRRYLKWTLQPN